MEDIKNDIQESVDLVEEKAENIDLVKEENTFKTETIEETKEVEEVESVVEQVEETPKQNSLTTQEQGIQVNLAVGSVKEKIVGGALTQVNNSKSINKHSNELTKVANDAIKADIEKERLKVEHTNANNRAEKQEIKNKLIELKTEAKRLKREEKQILKEQKEEHKKRSADILWARYEKKLTKMKYSYVPNKVVLTMLLFFDGVAGFFTGLGQVSNAIMKAIKWFLIIGITLSGLLIVPSTREWLLELMGFIG